MRVVDHFDRTPKHVQIADIVRDQIRADDLKPMTPIPSEPQMVEIHGVARKTARMGVRILADEEQAFTLPSRGRS